MGSVVGLLTFL